MFTEIQSLQEETTDQLVCLIIKVKVHLHLFTIFPLQVTAKGSLIIATWKLHCRIFHPVAMGTFHQIKKKKKQTGQNGHKWNTSCGSKSDKVARWLVKKRKITSIRRNFSIQVTPWDEQDFSAKGEQSGVKAERGRCAGTERGKEWWRKWEWALEHHGCHYLHVPLISQWHWVDRGNGK